MKKTTSIRFLLLVACACVAVSCAKNDDGGDRADLLAGTRWQATLIDENPETSPRDGYGEWNSLYYPWQDCHMDDTFTFKNSNFFIDDNGSVCEGGVDLIFEKSSQSYTYDEASKQLLIGTGEDAVRLQVYELTETRLKIGAMLPPGAATYDHLIFLFKRK